MGERLIACKLPAEPGWRVVRLEEREEGIVALVDQVKWWGLVAPYFELPKPDHVSVMNLFTQMDMSGLFGSRAREPVPMNEDGKQLDPRWLVPPCDKTDNQLLHEMTMWLNEVIERNPQMFQPKVPSVPTGSEPMTANTKGAPR